MIDLNYNITRERSRFLKGVMKEEFIIITKVNAYLIFLLRLS